MSAFYGTKLESGAAPLAGRLAALKALSDAGCKTWVIIEPYPTPNVHEQELQPILDAVSFAGQMDVAANLEDRGELRARVAVYERLLIGVFFEFGC